jgi:CheY-like chemotaxis protein
MPHPLAILIAEDLQDSGDTLAQLLSVHGFNVRVVLTGLQAVQAFASSPADVVILDMGMPEMTGVEAARKICEMCERKPLLIAITGYEHFRDECNAIGFQHYFLKPVDPIVLINHLRLHAEFLKRQPT